MELLGSLQEGAGTWGCTDLPCKATGGHFVFPSEEPVQRTLLPKSPVRL